MASKKNVEKLRTLGVFPDTLKRPNSVKENTEIFERCGTLEEISVEVSKRHWACSPGQFVYFHLEALLKQDPNYKFKFIEDAKECLRKSSVSPEHIQGYFQSGADPGLVFRLNHEGEYGQEIRRPFYNKANQFALNKLREWLGFTKSW